MQQEDLIPAKEFCNHYQINIQLIYSFSDLGLIETYRIEDEDYLDALMLARLEKLVRLHTELGINPEGLDAISNLLEKIEQLQEEVGVLKSRLKFKDDIFYA